MFHGVDLSSLDCPLDSFQRQDDVIDYVLLHNLNLLLNVLLDSQEEMLEDLDAGLSNLLENETSDGNHGQAAVVNLLGLEDSQLLSISGLEAKAEEDHKINKRSGQDKI